MGLKRPIWRDSFFLFFFKKINECLFSSIGKKVSVFEGNWFETGAPGTSDMATMVSSDNGTSAGKNFLTYIPPPGNEANAVNPFTKLNFAGQFSHLYLFSKNCFALEIFIFCKS